MRVNVTARTAYQSKVFSLPSLMKNEAIFEKSICAGAKGLSLLYTLYLCMYMWTHCRLPQDIRNVTCVTSVNELLNTAPMCLEDAVNIIVVLAVLKPSGAQKKIPSRSQVVCLF